MDKKDLQEILNHYVNGTATPEEKRFLEAYYDHFEQRPDPVHPEVEQALSQYREEVLINLHHQINPAQESVPYPARVIRSTWFRYVAAACILLFVTTVGAYLWTANRQQPVVLDKEQKAKQNDLYPGGQKAMLTLADGNTIVLDYENNGTLTRQGNASVVKLAHGQLSYKSETNLAAPTVFNTLSTPKGGQYQLTLPEGTRVWLNASSSITFPTVFAGHERPVSITGEVYFEVAKDPARPFKVSVGDMKVEVLGTHFNINAYPDESTMKTTLLEGSVRVSRSLETAILKPGQQSQLAIKAATVQQQQSIQVINNTDLEQVIAWKNGYFQFHETDLRTVMRQLARWYDVEVVYEGNVPNDNFDGELPMDANALQVLRALEKTQVHFRIEGKKIIVTP